jgi:uncharacterized repeat protein (TIGR03803 family)
MRKSDLYRFALGICAAGVLAGCGGGGSTPLSPSPAGRSCFGAACAQGNRSARHDKPRTNVSPAYGVIYNFKGYPSDGDEPYSGVASINGALYGTTYVGGAKNTGTTFAVSPGSQQEVHLYSFGGAKDPEFPKSGVSDLQGAVYGTSYGGGTSYGTVFTISSNKPVTLYPFKGGTDGENPAGELTYIRSSQTFYGTTEYGGAHGVGTVFEIAPGSGYEKATVLYSFKGVKGATDGANPTAGLFNTNGTLYGTTELGGKYNEGTVYAISLTGKESVIHSFGGSATDGQYPHAGVRSPGVSLTLYGTTYNGGVKGKGTVFSITTSGKEAVVYSFKGHPDAENPLGETIYINGALYGTTAHGGVHNGGAVFKISSSNVETVLHDFPSYSGDGKGPADRLIEVNGKLYGTTRFGGNGKCIGGGCGTVFWVLP